MKKQLRIILYGDTLVLGGMRLSLEANPDFEVISLNAPEASGQELQGEQELFALQPDVVIYDTSSVRPRFHYVPIGSSLQLIGIDPGWEQALVWSGQHLTVLSVQDLVEVIAQVQHGKTETGKCGEPVSQKIESHQQPIKRSMP
jgi:hypothetical protein